VWRSSSCDSSPGIVRPRLSSSGTVYHDRGPTISTHARYGWRDLRVALSVNCFAASRISTPIQNVGPDSERMDFIGQGSALRIVGSQGGGIVFCPLSAGCGGRGVQARGGGTTNATATILWLRLAWALALPALGDEAPAHAVDDLRGRVQALVKPLLEKKQSVGVVVGVVEAGQTHVFGFGREALGGDKVPDGKTIFEIGSITKVFTSLALADMAQQSLVRLDGPVQRYLPKEVNVASRAGREITLEDLATHTSGLPRIPLKMVFLGVKSNNPYATYKEKDLYDFLKI
jgi:hypothetical protein